MKQYPSVQGENVIPQIINNNPVQMQFHYGSYSCLPYFFSACIQGLLKELSIVRALLNTVKALLLMAVNVSTICCCSFPRCMLRCWTALQQTEADQGLLPQWEHQQLTEASHGAGSSVADLDCHQRPKGANISGAGEL
jgi:hypothetical protein